MLYMRFSPFKLLNGLKGLSAQSSGLTILKDSSKLKRNMYAQ